MVTLRKVSIVLLIALLGSPFYLHLQMVRAEQTPTLAGTIHKVLGNIQVADSAWNVVYGQVFGLQDESVFDSAIVSALNQNDFDDVIFIARLAELNNYSSPIINDSVLSTLRSISMCGSLPITTSNPVSFLLYNRYMINAYRYAQELNVSGWNLNQAYLDFVKAYVSPPKNSQNGEMLWINPENDYSESFASRYYDEHAETLDMFLEFALNGINDSVLYADDAWINTQSHWNGAIYGYSNAFACVECEMGNFAQIIAEYRNARGDIPYFDRVISGSPEQTFSRRV